MAGPDFIGGEGGAPKSLDFKKKVGVVYLLSICRTISYCFILNCYKIMINHFVQILTESLVFNKK